MRTAGGNQPVTSGGRASPGMRRTSMARRPGTLDNHSHLKHSVQTVQVATDTPVGAAAPLKVPLGPGDRCFPLAHDEEKVTLIAEVLHAWWSSEQVNE